VLYWVYKGFCSKLFITKEIFRIPNKDNFNRTEFEEKTKLGKFQVIGPKNI